MKNKIKIIDLLCLISNGEEVPKRIKYEEYEYEWDLGLLDYIHKNKQNTISLFDEYICNLCNDLNDELEILDEEDKDIPLIPDDDLYIINKKNGISEVNGTKYGTDKDTALNYNFKVLKEKINQVVEELNKRQ